jgi:hypothetical protein
MTRERRWPRSPASPRSKPVVLEAAREKLTVLVRTFTSERAPETGKMKVVALCPNP